VARPSRNAASARDTAKPIVEPLVKFLTGLGLSERLHGEECGARGRETVGDFFARHSSPKSSEQVLYVQTRPTVLFELDALEAGVPCPVEEALWRTRHTRCAFHRVAAPRPERIHLEALELSAHIGVPDAERLRALHLTLEPQRDFRALGDRIENQSITGRRRTMQERGATARCLLETLAESTRFL
jgi:hypothetical protein